MVPLLSCCFTFVESHSSVFINRYNHREIYGETPTDYWRDASSANNYCNLEEEKNCSLWLYIYIVLQWRGIEPASQPASPEMSDEWRRQRRQSSSAPTWLVVILSSLVQLIANVLCCCGRVRWSSSSCPRQESGPHSTTTAHRDRWTAIERREINYSIIIYLQNSCLVVPGAVA